MTFSYYYADPDGNNVELQVDNFGDWSKSTRVDARPRTSSRRTRSASSSTRTRVAADHADGVPFDEIHAKAMAGGYAPEQAPVEIPEAVMRLCRFEIDGLARSGIVEGEEVVDRDGDERHPLADVRLLAPVLPRKFLAIGLNYADHIAESGMEAPEFPVFFNKQATCVVGPGDDVHMPRVSSLLDYEGELAIVIGKRCRHVPRGRARTR